MDSGFGVGDEFIGYSKPINVLKNKQFGLSALWTNGANNLYPTYVQNSIDGSSTGSMAHKMNKEYIIGDLHGDDFLVNVRKRIYLSSLLDAAASDLSAQGGFYIHRNLVFNPENGKFEPTEGSIIPYENARISKNDDHGYFSRVFVSEKFSSLKTQSFKTNEMEAYYVFTNNQDEIKYQIQDYATKKKMPFETTEDIIEAVRAFPGQVFFATQSNEFPYPSSPVAAVLPDMVSEFYISQYINYQSIDGFMGKVVAFVLEDDKQDDENIVNDFADWLGTRGSSGIYVKMMKSMDDIEKLMVIKHFQSNFDDKLFSETKKTLRDNILGSFDNLPSVLAFSGDGALFGTNPETFENAKKFYKENTAKKREFLNNTVKDVLGIYFKLD